MEVISITTSLSRYGGAQKVLMDVHSGLKGKYNCKIIGFQKYSTLHKKYNIAEHEYIKFVHPWQINNRILLVHSRNLLPLLIFLKKIFLLNTRIVYVSHNVYNTYRIFTPFPENIVSISEKVTRNLTEYFGVDQKKIHLIYNGIKDLNLKLRSVDYGPVIKILYAARVNKVKQQVELVKHIKELSNIEIHFAGTGDDIEELKKICSGSATFKVLGFVENMQDVMKEYHFLMLYSVQEGLPISLIEGVMCGKPLLVNDVGGNLEIGVPGINGILLGEWQNLKEQLQGLEKLTQEEYVRMSENSRRVYLEKFQYDKMISGYFSLIEQIREENKI